VKAGSLMAQIHHIPSSREQEQPCSRATRDASQCLGRGKEASPSQGPRMQSPLPGHAPGRWFERRVHRYIGETAAVGVFPFSRAVPPGARSASVRSVTLAINTSCWWKTRVQYQKKTPAAVTRRYTPVHGPRRRLGSHPEVGGSSPTHTPTHDYPTHTPLHATGSAAVIGLAHRYRCPSHVVSMGAFFV
jgi:hypothetical protein